MNITFWNQEFKVNMWIGTIGALLISITASLFGFGGGPFMVPLMTVALRLPMFLVVGSSLLAIFFNTTVSSIQYYQLGKFDLILFCVMFPAAILGGWIAPKIAKRTNPVIVKRIAAVGLTILGLQLVGAF